MISNVSKLGYSYYNSCVESFCNIKKRNIFPKKSCAIIEEIARDVFEYIEII